MSAPKVFISYSWSTAEHEQWVIDLATELVESGVDVVLDKWALREGHDSVAFMEQMVTDPSITKVLLVCDEVYASKADGRTGGVGTETQIVSREVYEKRSQEKFVAVVCAKDEEGKPYLPTYYKSRIYIDLSESERYSENYEKLLRWIFDKPLYVKPALGNAPEFLNETDSPSLGTSALAKRTIEAFRNKKDYAEGALDEYLITFSQNMERFRITEWSSERDEDVVRSVEEFVRSRDELITVVGSICKYADAASVVRRLHRFLESLIPYLSRPAGVSSWNEGDFDNFRFVVHELFLYLLALLLRDEHFGAASYLLSQPYYVPQNAEYGRDVNESFSVFRSHMRSLAIRSHKLRRLSSRADLLELRAKSSGVPFRGLMQADLVCFLRASLHGDRWWPETLLYAERHYGPFEIFARAISKTYLADVLKVLGVSSLEPILEKLEHFAANPSEMPRWEGDTFNLAMLLGADRLGSRE